MQVLLKKININLNFFLGFYLDMNAYDKQNN